MKAWSVRRVGRVWVAWLAALVLVSGMVAGHGAAESQGYASEEECSMATKNPCYQSGEGGTWLPDTDPRTGGQDNHDAEFLARTARAMAVNISGTRQNPVVAVDFEQVSFPDVQPMLDPAVGRVRVPIRFVSEKMGAKVSWEQSTKTVTIEREGLTITLQVDNPTIRVNGEEKTLDAPPILHDDRVLVPLRYIAEMFGAAVDWVGDQPPSVEPVYEGRFQVWIWIPWGYWKTTGLETRLQTYAYRRD